MIGRTKAKGTYHEWQEDSLAAADGANKRNEGNDATFTVPTPTVRRGNYTQISDKTAIVSETLEEVSKAGRKSEMAREMSKRSRELKIDVETILLSNQAAASADPRALGGIGAWIATNVDMGATGTNPTQTSGAPTDARNDGTQRALTEAMVKTVVQSCWTNGAEPSIIMAGAFNNTAVSAFAGNAQSVVNLAGAKPGVIVASMDVYVSEFGNLKVVPNRWQRARDLFVLDPSHMAIAFLRGYKSTPLAKTGDAQKRLINVEYTFEMRNEKSQGAVYDLLTS
jgi:hypothetical protein